MFEDASTPATACRGKRRRPADVLAVAESLRDRGRTACTSSTDRPSSSVSAVARSPSVHSSHARASPAITLQDKLLFLGCRPTLESESASPAITLQDKLLFLGCRPTLESERLSVAPVFARVQARSTARQQALPITESGVAFVPCGGLVGSSSSSSARLQAGGHEYAFVEPAVVACVPRRSDVGRALRVYWSAESQWFPGVLVEIGIGHDDGGDEGDYRVQYGDGDEQVRAFHSACLIFVLSLPAV